jgi:CheY-like chemotaxis protein
VDDDALVLMNTAAMLEDLGHVVTEAFSGDAALKLMRDGHEFDLVITDHAMPRMTGMDLAKALRAEWPRLPIVMATGYAELPEGNVLNLPKLSKPFDQAQLEDAVATAFSMRRNM